MKTDDEKIKELIIKNAKIEVLIEILNYTDSRDKSISELRLFIFELIEKL